MKCALPFSIHHDNPCPIPMQHDFLSTLPFDIIDNIISRLTQLDCLECMAVSRLWYKLIPQYTTHLWRKVEICLQENPRFNVRILHCLGPHVQTVQLAHCNEEQTHAILSTLFRYHCTLHSIEFRKCIIVDQIRFVTMMRQISSNLKVLTFIEHNYNMAFLNVIQACPQLTHFSYSVHSYAPPEVYDIEPLPLPSCSDTNLTYLCLDAVLSKTIRTAPLLQKCPKLKCLLISNIAADSDFYVWPTDSAIDLDLFFRYCPNIQYLKCNAFGFKHDRWIQNANKIQSQAGVRELITRTAKGYGANQIIPFIQRHASTLNTLSLDDGYWTDDSDWSPLAHLHLQHLDTFSCKYLKFEARVLSLFLLQSPALTRVTLWCMQEIANDVLTALNALVNLSQLDMGVNSTTLLPSEQSWCWFFANAKLKSLTLRWGHFVTDQVLHQIGSMDPLEELALLHTARNASSMEPLTRLKNLKRLELWSVQAPLDQVLADMPWVPRIALVHCPTVTNVGLRVLVDAPQSKLSRLRIEHCRSIHFLTIEYIQQKIESVRFR
ncbi:hypothetical protein BJV82DRAFT_631559 [Fennellomyces sp. T-0311]|nr:hypothetical protein BJV82DRAFT_631559 [Fennellomyces sp. T-0311]